eukprot:6407601-Ditylum_brightwellii.AAC.1
MMHQKAMLRIAILVTDTEEESHDKDGMEAEEGLSCGRSKTEEEIVVEEGSNFQDINKKSSEMRLLFILI